MCVFSIYLLLTKIDQVSKKMDKAEQSDGIASKFM